MDVWICFSKCLSFHGSNLVKLKLFTNKLGIKIEFWLSATDMEIQHGIRKIKMRWEREIHKGLVIMNRFNKLKQRKTSENM